MHGMEADGDGIARLRGARERMAAAFSAIAAGAGAVAARAELDRLRAELEEERIANAQLQERVRALKERAPDAADSRRLEEELSLARAEIARLREEAARDRDEIEAILRELVPLVEEAR